MARVLVTGGAGFVGSHLVDAAVAAGHSVRVLDSLDSQVHETKPSYLNPHAEYAWGDVRDRKTIEAAIADIDLVYHEAAAVGVGQSMYEIERYVEVNTMGTALLLDVLVNKEHGVKKLVVASSMSIYGEGVYRCPSCSTDVQPGLRPDEALRAGRFEHACPTCAGDLRPGPTPETKRLECTSVYAQTKKDQEEYALIVGRAYGLPTVALRYFNVYGPRQALSNPYTGVCAIFSARVKNRNPPVVYEDGRQTRDFIDVRDIVRANLLAAATSRADYKAVNVGSGKPQEIVEVARLLIRLYGGKLQPKVEGQYRPGDIRHCFADTSRARELLGFEAQIPFEEGMRELASWGARVDAKDRFEDAARELREHGLL